MAQQRHQAGEGVVRQGPLNAAACAANGCSSSSSCSACGSSSSACTGTLLCMADAATVALCLLLVLNPVFAVAAVLVAVSR